MARLVFALTLVILLPLLSFAEDWPGWMGPDRDGVWKETGILDTFPKDGPKVLWRTPISGGYAGPAVVGDQVFVTDLVTDANVNKLSSPGGQPEVKGKERVLCLDAKTGKELWKHEYDVSYKISYPTGPRCTPTVADGKVYTLGAEGVLLCLDAKKGDVLWKKDFKADFKAKTPFWGYSSHPLVHGKKLICAVGGDNTLIAFNKETGEQIWAALKVPAEGIGYCPPSIIKAANKEQLLFWDPEKINSLDPETGKVYWDVDLKPSYAMSINAPQKLGDYLFAGGIGERSALLKLASDKPGAEVVWRGKRGVGLYPANATPILDGEMMYGTDCFSGAFIGAEIKTGKRLWTTFKPTTGAGQSGHGTAFVVKNGDRFFLMSETGVLIIAKLSAKEYEEISRVNILKPTSVSALGKSRDVVWSHPAFANQCVYARNDKEIVCVSLAKETGAK